MLGNFLLLFWSREIDMFSVKDWIKLFVGGNVLVGYQKVDYWWNKQWKAIWVQALSERLRFVLSSSCCLLKNRKFSSFLLIEAKFGPNITKKSVEILFKSSHSEIESHHSANIRLTLRVPKQDADNIEKFSYLYYITPL